MCCDGSEVNLCPYIDEGTLINKIRFLSTEQKERVLNFVESVESSEPFGGLCFNFKALKNINIDILVAAVRDGVALTT